MTLKKVENTEKNVVEIEFTIDKATFEAETVKVYKKNVSKMNIPGFRKGKAPKAIIEKLYGKGVFYEDAINNLLPDAFDAAAKEAGKEAVSRPDFEITDINDEGVEVKATFYVKPEVEIKNYKGIEVERVTKPVTDADVEEELKRVQNRNSRSIEVTDRPVQNGDTIALDFDGYTDGKQFDGGKAEKYSLTVGSGTFIPGFEDQIVGKNIGEDFDVNVTFPEEYGAKELAGKPAVFKCKVHSISYTQLPEIDDEFAKDVSEFDTLDEYKADIKAKLEEKNKSQAEMAMEGSLIDALIANLTADIPAPMIEAEAENIIRDRDYRLRMQGLDLNAYLQYTGMTLDSMREEVKPEAERQVKVRLAVEKIAELEKIEATEADIEAEYETIAKSYNMEVKDVKASLEAEALAKDISARKTIEFIKNNAKITDVAEASEAPKKASPKKTTTKKTTTTAKKTTAKADADKVEAAEKPAKKTTKASTAKAEGEATEKKPAAKKTTTKKTTTKKTEE